MNIDKLKQEADEYQKYLNRVAQLAEEKFAETGSEISKSAKETADNVKDNISAVSDAFKYGSQQAVGQQSNTEKLLSELRAKGFEDYKSLREKEFNELKVSLAQGEISNEEYYTRLAQLRDIYFSEGSNEWTQYTLQIAKYNQSVIEEQGKLIEDFAKELKSEFRELDSEYEDSFSSILKKQSDVKSRLEGISDIYNKIEAGDSKNGGYRWIQLSDINTEIEVLKNYNASLIAARDKINEIFDTLGLDSGKTAELKSGFLGELAKMNVRDATQFSKYLTNLPTERLTDYLSKWAEKSELEALIPSRLFGEEAESLVKRYAEDMSQSFTKSLEEKFGEIPDSFFKSGGSSAEQFKEGFIDAIDKAMGDISAEINQRIKKLLPEINLSGTGNQVTNNSSYNIYGAASPEKTALEIYKEETKKRMLIGDN